jgi:hypothetical protein
VCRRARLWNQERRKNVAPPPVLTPERYMPFDRLALLLYQLAFWIAPSWWLIDSRKRYNEPCSKEQQQKNLTKQEWETACYVTAWFAILVVLWRISPSDRATAETFGYVALFRLLEIAITVLGFVLDQREPKIARSLVTISILAMQVVLIFAILDHSFARHAFLKPQVVTQGHAVARAAATPFEYLYLSWTYMTTLGNQYAPASTVARLLQLGANTSGILLLGIVAARAIGLISDTRMNRNGQPARPAAGSRAAPAPASAPEGPAGGRPGSK